MGTRAESLADSKQKVAVKSGLCNALIRGNPSKFLQVPGYQFGMEPQAVAQGGPGLANSRNPLSPAHSPLLRSIRFTSWSGRKKKAESFFRS